MAGKEPNMTPQAIAVTGCIGSGKSKVARWLGHEWELPVYNSDDEVRALLQPGEHGWSLLKEILDETYFNIEGRLVTSKLRQAIFTDAKLRQAIEDVIHPLLLKCFQKKTDNFTKPCVVEVPLLYEVKWQSHFSKVIVVSAPPMVCIRRVMARDQVSESQALAALHTQGAIQEKLALADFTIDNSGPWIETLSQLETIKKIGRPQMDKKKLDTFCL